MMVIPHFVKIDYAIQNTDGKSLVMNSQVHFIPIYGNRMDVNGAKKATFLKMLFLFPQKRCKKNDL
jgi:hypothetical protein